VCVCVCVWWLSILQWCRCYFNRNAALLWCL
jgi:hypothetical protein